MVLHNIEGKVAVVTGASQGIGLAIVEEFLVKGAKTVIIVDIKDDIELAGRLNKKYGSNKVIYIKCDVTKELDAASKVIFETVGVVDILVNNAGIMNESSVRKTMEINAIAVMEWTLKFFAHMREKKNNGAIINISSTYGFRIDPHSALYKASKFAVMGFSKTLGHSVNFCRYGIRVMVVCPGVTDTNLHTNNDNTVKMFEDQPIEECLRSHKNVIHQKTETIGKAVAEVYETASSGTAWLVENEQPIREV